VSSLRFTITTRQTGHRRIVTVVVYDAVADLRRAARNYRAEDQAAFEDAQACSQPRYMVTIGADGSETRSDHAGIVRLVRGQGAAILAHEMVHMGLAIYRSDMGRASLRNMKNEETLAHIVSDLVRGANSKLWKLGVYA
jgi:hypothetical protein